MKILFSLLGAVLILTTQAQEIPVDLLTGRAQITIPISQVSAGSISASVFLSYESGGVKPLEGGGNAGMNWQVVAGGSVRRTVRSLPDDYFGSTSDTRRGWLADLNAQQINSFLPAGDDNLGTCGDEITDWNFLNGLGYSLDTEPDIFSFNAPGLSGQFVFGSDKQPKQIPYQDLKITVTQVTPTSPISQIVITRNDGVKYSFTYEESTVRQVSWFVNRNAPVSQLTTDMEMYRQPLQFTSAWYLTSISSPTGQISFCYGTCALGGNPSEETNQAVREVRVTNTSSSATSEAFRQYAIKDVTTRSFLSKITGQAQDIEIYYTHPNLVSRVSTVDRALGNRKNYKFNYMEARNASEPYGRQFLESLTEGSDGCENFPSYSFSYYDLTSTSGNQYTTNLTFVKPSSETAQTPKLDYWGYFNNMAQSLNPTVYFYAGKSNAERYRYYPIPNLTATATINGANRAVNPATIIFGSLKEITYPSGGKTVITYEPNQYFDLEANTSQYGPGLRIKKIDYTDPVASSPTMSQEYQYQMTNGSSSGKMIYRSVFGYHDVGTFYALQDDQSPDPFVLYERATRKQTGLGSTVYEYLLPGTYPLTTHAPDWNATKTKVARNNCAAVGQLTNGFYQFPFANNTNFDFERGLPSKITDFHENGQRVRESVFTYTRLASPVTVVKGLRFYKLNGTTNIGTGAHNNANLFVYGQYTLLTNLNKVTATETVSTWDMADPNRSVSTARTFTYHNTHYLLSETTTTNSDGTILKTRYKYARDFATLTQPNPADVKSVMLKKINDDHRHATPIEVIQSVNNGTETVTGATLTLFGSFPDSLNSIRALPAETRMFNGTTGFQEAVVIPASGANQVLTVNSSVYRVASSILAYDFAGNPLTVQSGTREVTGTHYGYHKSLPVLTVANATHDEVVFSDFETYSSGQFNPVPVVSATYAAGWSGRRALQLNTGMLLERTGVKKGKGKFYRFTCRVQASAARQLTYKIFNGATVVATGTVNYAAGDANQWKFLESRLDMTPVPATFKVTVETSGLATVDDIAFYPEAAILATTTHEPLKGITSATNSAGISAFTEYDNLGRAKYLKDQDKGLRKIADYYLSRQNYPTLTASFNATHAVHQVVKNVTVQYTTNAFLNCGIAPVTYDWYIDGVKLGSNTTSFSYSFTQAKTYVLKLVASHPVYPAAVATVTYDVKEVGVGALQVGLVDQAGTNAYAYCDANYNKTFTATLSGCYVTPDVTVEWTYHDGFQWRPMVSPEISLQQNPLTITFDPIALFNGASNFRPYQIKCLVYTVCPVTGVASSHAASLSIAYNGSTQCQ